MIVVNFSHPLTPHQREQVEAACDQAIERVIDVPVHCDHAVPCGPQAASFIAAAGLSAAEWQSLPIVVVPPSLSAIALACLADLHGRMGYFPTVIRLRPRPDAVPPAFDLAEVLDLQRMRDTSRSAR